MEVRAGDRSSDTDIYTLDLVTGTYTQLTFKGDHDNPVWSPNGTHLLFASEVRTNPAGEELFIKPADNSGAERRVTRLNLDEVKGAQWLDDTLLVFDARVPGRGDDIFITKADSGSVPVPYLQTPANEYEPRVSPDRTLIAFGSNETGSGQVWLRDFPVPQGKWNISRGRGAAARWSPDGRYVYFWRGTLPLDSLFRARVDRTPSIVVQAPEFVLAIDVDNISSWDFHPDGRRFIVNVPVRAGASSTGAPMRRYLILQNWFGELRRLTAAKPQ